MAPNDAMASSSSTRACSRSPEAARRSSIQAYHFCTDSFPRRSLFSSTNASADRKWPARGNCLASSTARRRAVCRLRPAFARSAARCSATGPMTRCACITTARIRTQRRVGAGRRFACERQSAAGIVGHSNPGYAREALPCDACPRPRKPSISSARSPVSRSASLPGRCSVSMRSTWTAKSPPSSVMTRCS